MPEPRRPALRSVRAVVGGLRTRLALSILAITTLTIVGSFAGLQRATRADLEERIDRELNEQFVEFEQHPAARRVRAPGDLVAAAEQFIASQRYHPESTVFLVQPATGRSVTNQPELLHEDDPGGLLDAPAGLADVEVEDAGRLRVLSRPIVIGGEQLGTFRVAEPLEPVDQATQSLRNAWIVVAAAALLVALAAALSAASLITRPLRRMAGIASAVNAGDLSHRCDVDTSDEVGLLADSFNRMLDRLESAFERQRAFVSDASHELRTPLTILRGQAEQLRREDDPARRRQIVELLLREIDRMGRLVEDMLTLARTESGTAVEPRTIDLEDFFADLARDLRLFGDREYVVDGPATGILEADPDRLGQVLRNLVQNAARHTAPGDRIVVAARPFDGRIEFSVSDAGPGIPEDQLELVFDRFHRTDAARSRDAGGSGLGLAIARAIVEAHGGSIRAEPAPEGGARIRFDLPGYRASAG